MRSPHNKTDMSISSLCSAFCVKNSPAQPLGQKRIASMHLENLVSLENSQSPATSTDSSTQSCQASKFKTANQISIQTSLARNDGSGNKLYEPMDSLISWQKMKQTLLQPAKKLLRKLPLLCRPQLFGTHSL